MAFDELSQILCLFYFFALNVAVSVVYFLCKMCVMA